MDVSEIVDRESFKAWLEALPKEHRYEWAVTLATRAALRVFPFWVAEMLRDWARERDLTGVPVCRSVLISAVAVKMPTADIKKAATAAAATAAAATTTATYAAAAATAADLWALLRADIGALQHGVDLRTRPLWPEDMPADMAEAWTKGRAWMEGAPGHVFWIRWYEAILAGRPLTQDWDSHWQLMHDIALIPDEEWGEGKEQDAIRVAGIIEEIEERYSYRVSGETAASADTLLKAALGRFGFNDVRRLMELLPFAEDLKQLKDPAAVEAFVAELDQQKHAIETFLLAVEREGRGLQGSGGILTYFEEVMSEISKARQLNTLNIGWIIECGEILQDYSQDAETIRELGPLRIPFSRTLENLLTLIHGHFSATILRFGVLRDIRSSEETRLSDLMEDLRRGMFLIKDELPEGHVPLAPETIAVFERLLDELEGLIRKEFSTTDPEVKSQLRKDIDYRLSQAAVSMRLYWEQSAAPRASMGQIVSAVTKKRAKDGVEGLFDMMLDVFTKN